MILPPPSALERPQYDAAFYALSIRNISNFSPPLFEPTSPCEADILAKLTLIATGQGADADPGGLHELMASGLAERIAKNEHSPAHGKAPSDLLEAVSDRHSTERLLDLMLRIVQGDAHFPVLLPRFVKGCVERIDLFLETAAILIRDEQDQPYQFWIVGDGPLREKSIAQAHSLGIADRVEFVGHVPSALPYLQALDLLVMCSDHEGTPMTLLEALQCQLPIVAHDVGGLRELLDGGECGHLVAEQSAHEYATAISCVLQSSALKEKYASNAIARVNDCYSAEKNTQAYLALYRQVITGTL